MLRSPATASLVLGTLGWPLNGTELPGLFDVRKLHQAHTVGVAQTRLNPTTPGSLVEGVSRHAPVPFGVSLSPGRSDDDVVVTPWACPIPQVWGSSVHPRLHPVESRRGDLHLLSPPRPLRAQHTYFNPWSHGALA